MYDRRGGGGGRQGGGYGGQGGGYRGGQGGGGHQGGGYGGHGGHGGGQGGHGGGGFGRRDDRDNHDRRGVPLSELDPALTEMSRKVIGCAIEVHKLLGPGYSREIYLKALCLEMDSEELSYKIDHAFDVDFDGDIVGQTVATLYVGERFLVEVLARVGEVGTAERTQLRAQLRSADTELGLIINFGERRLKDGLVRVLNPDKLNPQDDDDDEYEDDDEGEEGDE
jgi:GxxExxY protein